MKSVYYYYRGEKLLNSKNIFNDIHTLCIEQNALLVF